jgi:acetylornithine deacetylase
MSGVDLESLTLNEDRYVGLLTKLIGEVKYLQNSPAQGLIPKEDLAIAHLMGLLGPHSKENGGPLEIEKVNFVEGRGNLIIKYPGTSDNKICSFVGSHLDVVPADPKGWDRNPYELVIEGDMLYGRGTTDCLGHVALLTEFLVQLGEKRPALKRSIVVVFIANEENGSFLGVGVDQLDKEGYMEELKGGPLFWIDSADSQPCIGTAGNMQWNLKVKGKLFHSGLPHLGINPIEMAMDTINYLQKRFYADYPAHDKEKEYNYATPSTFKPTQISCSPGSLNQLPPEAEASGDIRLTPFYDVRDVEKSFTKYVDEINKDPNMLRELGCHGNHAKYVLLDEGKKGIVEFKWLGEGENGIACNLNSPGYKALSDATKNVLGEAKPFSIGGSLPLVRELQDSGYDVQISGYGFSNRYHADNEAVSLNNMKNAFKIVCRVVNNLENL